MKVLIVEDEEELAKNIAGYLSGENYVCEFALNFKQALHKIESHQYDCILLDLMLPGGDGMKILEELKNKGKEEGVLIISAKNSLEDKINGLNLGADDYLAKPFHLPELAARIFSVVRRRKFSNTNIITYEELQLDLLAKRVQVGNQVINLTKTELDLLVYFIGNKNRVISKSALAEHISGDVADMMDSHDFVYSHIKNLKKKLTEAGCTNYIKTVYGTGYKWEQ